MNTSIGEYWYKATHYVKTVKYDPPLRVDGSYFSVMGMRIVGQRRWYTRLMRILWGVNWQYRTRMGKGY